MASRAARRSRLRRRRRRTLLAVGALLAVVAAAAVAALVTRTDDSPAVAPAADTTTSSSTVATTTTTPRDPRRGNGQPVVFAFGGDVHFEGTVRTKLLADPASVFADAAPVLSAADVAVVNLETAITESTGALVKEWVFKAPASAIDALRAGGIDAASMANNHGIDYGAQGLADSLLVRAATQYPILGIGANATEAYTPLRLDVKGQRIAVFAATDVMGEEFVSTWTATDTQAGMASTKYDAEARMVAAIQAVRPEVDTIAVMLHWGVERTDCPSPRQQALARALVDAGADIVVGSHAHHLLGGGRLGTAFVDYGLGNFAFFNEAGEYGRTGILVVTATGRDTDSYQWVPARIRSGSPVPFAPGPDADAEVAHWNELRACTDLAP